MERRCPRGRERLRKMNRGCRASYRLFRVRFVGAKAVQCGAAGDRKPAHRAFSLGRPLEKKTVTSLRRFLPRWIESHRADRLRRESAGPRQGNQRLL